MAKIRRGIFTLQGTVHDLTFVDSIAYGPHVRAPRGTYRKANCNAALTHQYQRTALLNGAAKGVFDVLKAAGATCRDSFLWQRMLSRLRQCERNDLRALMKTLEGLELHVKFPLQALFGKRLIVETFLSNDKMVVCLEHTTHPRFPKKVDAYRYEVGIIYCDDHLASHEYAHVMSDWIYLKDVVPELTFDFENRKAVYCLMYVHLQARQGNEVIESCWGNRMGVVKWVGKVMNDE